MKRILLILLLTVASTFACSPYFPPSYISDLDDTHYFIENINLPMELMVLAQEYNLIDATLYPTSTLSSAEADLADFAQCAKKLQQDAYIPIYTAFANAIRNNPHPEGVTVPELPMELREFTLYLEGVQEMKNNPDLLTPPAWITLLELPTSNRNYRTVWTHYMLGNLAVGQELPTIASQHYIACRQAVRDGMKDSLGLASASFKREFLAQTNTADRIRCGVQTIGYYQQSNEIEKRNHCLDHFKLDFSKTIPLTEAHLKNALGLEVTALYYSGTYDPRAETVSEQLTQSPPLKITSRLAWFLYKRGETKRAAFYLKNCPTGDPLANWLRFRMAQRSGNTTEAIDHLRRWLDELQTSDRIIFGFLDQHDGRKPPIGDVHGILGNLLVTQGQMQDALVAFVQANSYSDAALIAERYLETDALKAYVDTFNARPAKNNPKHYLYKISEVDNPRELIEQSLSYLLARRLFREDRVDEARPYYPTEIAEWAQTYQIQMANSTNPRATRSIRSAYLFRAARILRWKGMELSGSELGPDYTIVNGLYDYVGIDEEIVIPTNLPPLYRKTAPAPDTRFHYRYRAAELAGQAAALTRNSHQRATILWCAGEWLKLRDPETADIYHKQLARIRFQPLANAADKLRWFPRPTPKLEKVSRSIDYIPPAELEAAAREYQTPIVETETTPLQMQDIAVEDSTTT